MSTKDILVIAFGILNVLYVVYRFTNYFKSNTPYFRKNQVVSVFGVKGVIVDIYPHNKAYQIEVLKKDGTSVIKRVSAKYVKNLY